MRRALGLLALASIALASACGSDGSRFDTTDGGGPNPGPGNGEDADVLIDAGTSDAVIPTGPAEVYGHSKDTLYKLDPETKGVVVVGKFSGCIGNVVDLALDENSNMFVTADGGLFRVDRTTAVCTTVKESKLYPNSLSFVPRGTLDPNVEALVGYFDAKYVRIDTTTGAISPMGDLNDGKGYASSGDIVSVKGGGTYLTVRGGGCDDCLVEVDPATGAFLKSYGTVGHRAVYGIAFWAGRAYGFSDSGSLFEITFGASSVTTSEIAMPSKPVNLSFWGAGSTTSAPLGPR